MHAWKIAAVLIAASLFACQCGDQVAALDVTLSVEPATLDFGEVPIGSTTRRIATLLAGSRGTVVLQAPVLEAPGTPIVVSYVAGELPASASREVTVDWTPATTDPLDAWITIPSDAASVDVRIHLIGRVVTCFDEDGDGAGVGASCASVDCNDGNAAIGPSVAETCNGIDDNCDGRVDEGDLCGTPPETCNGLDDDRDGLVDEDGVCPPESCNGLDDDRDGLVDEGGVCPPESCNGLDDDRDGLVDEDGVCGATGETCNGLDDDQNGAVDDVPGAGGACALAAGSGPAGLDCTSAGRLACNTFSGSLECRPPSGAIDCTATCNNASLSVHVEPYFRGELPGMVFQNPAGSGYSRPITVTFTPPVPRVAITCVDPDFPGNDATAFDAQGNVLDQKVFVGDGAPGSQPPNVDVQTLVGQPGRDIARVVLTPDPMDYVGYSAIGVCP